ncbi:MAG: 50S ribosomal protein L28 [Alphaproteobacteria bacterium]|nr:50S ribosomal protein L28 [Alphaproteobacteria bacterium]PPR14543.1 MAG: 50S ribosomal protein L28 [Alphaproteobacteria bacterium MarineAlpha12_Bin1]
MARRCSITGKGVLTGNNVSHANNRSRRRFLPNLQTMTMYSEALEKKVSMRVTTSAARTIEHVGGLDAYLKSAATSDLPTELRRLKKQLLKVTSETN